MKKNWLCFMALMASATLYSQWSWQNPYPQGNHLYGVDFIDTNTGWAVGHFGTIIHTIDGGQTWLVQQSGTTARLRCVFFTDSKIGWAAGLDSTILHTNDGGLSWSPQKSSISSRFRTIFFTDSLTGWTVGSRGAIVHTMNGGQTWITQNADTGYHLNRAWFFR
jgi:photosystem II stability/assembly factor-like uncharacterized protein